MNNTSSTSGSTTAAHHSKNIGEIPMHVFVVVMTLTAVSFVLALAWNSLIKSIIRRYVKDENSIFANILYVATVTIGFVLYLFVLIKFFPHTLEFVELKATI